MNESRLLIFANPTSGRGRGLTILQQITPALQSAGWTVEVRVEHPSHLDSIGDVETIDAMIVIGGDGTLRAAMERMIRLVGAEHVPPALVMGLGTANLMQQHLQLRYDSSRLADDVIGLLRNRKTIRIDTGMAGDHLFLLMASCGFDSLVVQRLASTRQGPITKLSYLAPILTSLRDYSFPRLTVEVDGLVVLDDRPAQVYVGNVPEYGTGFPVLDRATSFDQRLDVCIMPCESRHELIRLAMLTLVGRHHDASGVIYTTGQDIRITGPNAAPIQIDGEAAGTTPARIRLLQSRLAFIVR